MNAPLFPPFPPFPANPTTGQRFGTWVWNGAQWIPAGSSGVFISIQTFKTVGQTLTYIPSPGIVSAIVETIGGGGGGGAVYSQLNEGDSGGGGGSGGYSRKVLAASLVLGGVVVNIGAGGTPGIATQPTPPPLAGTGGVTSFGALCVSNGGGGGGGAGTGGQGQPGVGAPAGVGDVAFPGATGFGGVRQVFDAAAPTVFVHGGAGGCVFGGNAIGANVGNGTSAVGSSAAPNTGGGGGGAAVFGMPAGTAQPGGPGGSGICIVTEYCLGDSSGDCSGQAPVSLGACGPGWGGPC